VDSRLSISNITDKKRRNKTTQVAKKLLTSRKEKEKLCKQQKLLTSIKEKGPFGKKSPFARKEKGGSVRIRRVAGRQASRPLLIGLKLGRLLKRTLLTSVTRRIGN